MLATRSLLHNVRASLKRASKKKAQAKKNRAEAKERAQSFEGQSLDYRFKTPFENRIASIRGPIKSALKNALPALGALIAGPVGLGIGAATRAALYIAGRDESETLKQSTKDATKAAVIMGTLGAVGLLPGALGIATAGALFLGFSQLAAKSQSTRTLDVELLPKVKLEEFTPAFTGKVNQKLSSESHIEIPRTKGMGQKKAEYLQAQALLKATQVCCEQLSPTVAVTLAREVAMELVPKGGADEKEIEKVMAPVGIGPQKDGVQFAYLPKSTPAAASTNRVLLDPTVVLNYTSNAIEAMSGHERSHLKHRDIVAKMGVNTLVGALQMAGDQSLSPVTWSQSAKTEDQVTKAHIEISRDIEYRCDSEAVDELLAKGVERETISDAFQEIFGTAGHSKSPLSEHPHPKSRIEAVEKKLADKA